MLSGATRTRQRDDTRPTARPRSQHEPRPTAPGPHFVHDFTRVPVQAKLKVNTPGDSYEQEADRAAHELSEKSSCACAGKCSSCSSKRVQRKSPATSAESADVDPILNGPGHALDSNTRSFMEPYFGHDFSRVRVHSDPHAAASADSLGARAYTVGHHLVFGPGEYRPGSADGQRLLAHELTHVMQQSAVGPMIQREPKDTAASSPDLIVHNAPAQRQPACACLVFMHHDEPTARLAAQAMNAVCSYNLAIVSPRGTDRKINIPKVGATDPNELFPRHIFRECVDDDTRCRSFTASKENQESTDAAVIEEFAQRQFFLAIKDCSQAFSLPIVALHNNVIGDTAAYMRERNAVSGGLKRKGLPEKTRAELEAKQAKQNSIEGKTFIDKPPADPKDLPENTLPYATLELWLQENFPDAVRKRDPNAKKEKDQPTWKKTIDSPDKGLLAAGMTNIFKWCQAHDNSECYVGDPSRPNNVVWVTRRVDFEKLQGTKANVAMQTRVTPGESETDLSSMFVGDLMGDAVDRMKREPVLTKGTLGTVVSDVQKAKQSGFPNAHSLGPVFEELQDFLKRLEEAEKKEQPIVDKRQSIQFVNIETPKKERLEQYRDVKSILKTLDLHCCDQDSDAMVENAMTTGKLPKLD